jgi:epoxyqueuosine reductase
VSILGEIIKAKAKESGFDFCGIAKAEPLTNHKEYNEDFVRKKLHLPFSYLENNLEKRLDPGKIMPDVRSVIAVLLNYYPDRLIPKEDNFIISKYAYGKDYHPIMKKTQELIQFMEHEYGNIQTKAFVDSGSVLEKVWAQRCGIGWQGKNTLLINRNAGSFFFIGIILTNLDLEPDQPETDHCGSCNKCIKACPTGAIEKPYQLSISKCIAYQTIENKGPIPETLKGKFNNRIFGCDICQDICPFNKSAKPSKEPGFSPSEALTQMRKNNWLHLTQEQFDELFSDSSISRTGYQRLMKNIRFSAGI